MTCIVAVKHQGRVYMGADSCTTTEQGERCHVVAQKVWTVCDGTVAVGVAGDSAFAQLVRYRVNWSDPRKWVTDLTRWANVGVLTEVRAQLLALGADPLVSNDRAPGGSILLGTQGRLFEIEISCLQADECSEDYLTRGSGRHVANGALWASTQMVLTPQERVRLALEAASHHRADCAPPYDFVEA